MRKLSILFKAYRDNFSRLANSESRVPKARVDSYRMLEKINLHFNDILTNSNYQFTLKLFNYQHYNLPRREDAVPAVNTVSLTELV